MHNQQQTGIQEETNLTTRMSCFGSIAIKVMNIIVKMKFGSHLYGTATVDSDLDYKGVFLPSKKEVLLGKIHKSINHTAYREQFICNVLEKELWEQ